MMGRKMRRMGYKESGLLSIKPFHTVKETNLQTKPFSIFCLCCVTSFLTENIYYCPLTVPAVHLKLQH